MKTINKIKLILLILVFVVSFSFFINTNKNTYSIYKQNLNTKVYLSILDSSTTFTVTFNMHGADQSYPQRIKNYNDTVGELSVPTKTNNNFLGWYTQETGGEKVTSTTRVTHDLTLHARWKKIVCKIAPSGTLHSYGNTTFGTIPNSISIASGFAYDCDVNGDDVYDSTDERFYYLTSDSLGNGVLIYSNNYTNTINTENGGSPSCGANGVLYNTDRLSYLPPTNAITELPDASVWSNVELHSTPRQIKNQLGGNTAYQGNTTAQYSYPNKSSRLATTQEIMAACSIDSSVDITTTGNSNNLNNCTFLKENTKDFTPSGSSTCRTNYHLETPYATTNINKIFRISKSGFEGSDLNDTTKGFSAVRPVIEVPISEIEVYDRGVVLDTFNITFISNGGSSVEGMTVIENQPLGSLPNPPTKPGFIFRGWYEDNYTFLLEVTASTVPSGNVSYYAKWEEITVDPFPIVYSHGNSCTFNNGTVTGDYCSPVTDTNNKQYIDTGIALYTNENIDSDYEIGFTVKTYGSQVNSNATIMNTKNENTGYPGVVLRRKDSSDSDILLQSRKTSSTNEEKTYSISNIEGKKVVIYRISGDIYISIDGSEKVYVNTQYASSFSRTVWFGASPTAATGTTAQRFFVGEIEDMYIRFGTYYDNEVRMISFDANGGSTDPAPIMVGDGFKIDTLPTPVWEGHTFEGWYTAASGGTLITGNEHISADDTYYAHWSLDDKYTITLNPNGGQVDPESVEIDKNSTVGNSLPTPTRTGYTFDYWYKPGGEQVTTQTIVDDDITYTAHWTINSYTVTFEDGSGNIVETRTRDYNTAIGSPLPTATKPYHTLNGWWTASSGGTQITEQTLVTDTVTYYAQWSIIQHTVNFNAYDGFTVTTSVNVDHGSSIGAANLPTATYPNHYFDGWWTEASGGTRVTGNEVITSDGITYHAHFKNIYTITFDPDGGTLSIAPDTSIDVVDGESIGSSNLPSANKPGYIFEGWFSQTGSGGTEYDGTEIITQSDIYHAQWTESTAPPNNVYFMDDDNQTIFETVQVLDGGTVGGHMPSNPTRQDYVFDGWYINGNTLTPFNSATVVSGGDLTVVANWKEKISYATVTTTPSPLTIMIGTTGQITVSPTGSGLVEDYTYSSSNTNIATVVNGTVYGEDLGTVTITITGTSSQTTKTVQVSVINTRKVRFKDGDTLIREIDVVNGESIGSSNVPSSPTKSGYIFDRWYYYDGNDVTTTPLDVTKPITQDEEYQPRWAEDNMVAAVGTTYYTTLKLAIESVDTSNQTEVRVLQDITNPSGRTTVSSTQNIIVNAEGHTLSCGSSTSNNLLYSNGGILTVKNGTFTCGKSGLATLETTSSGHIYIESGTVSNTNNRGAIYNNGTVHILGGTLTSSATIRPVVQNAASGAKIIMSGGTIIQTTTSNVGTSGKDDGRGAIKVISSSSATITGGTIISNSPNSAGVYNSGTLVIGTKNSTYDTTTPIIQGENYGIESTETYSIFDGTIKGKTNNSAVNNLSMINETSGIEANSVRATGTDDGYYTLYYEIIQSKYHINFIYNGGEGTPDYLEFNLNEPITSANLPTPTRTLYTFGGWYTDYNLQTPFAQFTPTTSDTVNYYAKWNFASSLTPVSHTLTSDAMTTYFANISTWVNTDLTDPSNNDSQYDNRHALFYNSMRTNFDNYNCSECNGPNTCTSPGAGTYCDQPKDFETGLEDDLDVYLYENNAIVGNALTYTTSDNGVLYNLIPGKTYYWQSKTDNTKYGVVTATGNRRTLKTSIRNLRDLGGMSVSYTDISTNQHVTGTIDYGRLYRGAHITSGQTGINDLTKLGITREIDLRANGDGNNGQSKMDNYDVGTSQSFQDIVITNYLINPVATPYISQDHLDNYRNVKNALRKTMEYIVNGDNVYFHCTIGTDRTGTLAYFLEGLLGVSEEDRLRDYELSYFFGLTNRTRFHDFLSGSSIKPRFESMYKSYPTNQDIYNYYTYESYTPSQGEMTDDELLTAFRNAMITNKVIS